MLVDTFYAKYIKDREELVILENEFGFITYKISGKECFLANMYIDENQRQKGKGRELISQLSEIAHAKSCDVISANIHINDKNASKTLLAALIVGFKIARAEYGTLLIVKDIEGAR